MKQDMRDAESSEGRRENVVLIEQSLIRQIQEWLNKAGHDEKKDIRKCRALVKKERGNELFRELPDHTKRRLFMSLYCPRFNVLH